MTKALVFAAVLLGSLGLFAWSAYRYFRFIAFGQKEDRFDRIDERILSVLIFFLGQKKVAERTLSWKNRSLHHLFIFWGFLIITVGTVEILVSGVWPAFTFERIIGESAYHGLRASIDVFNLIVLVMIGWGFVRRMVVQPKFIPIGADAAIILGGIAALMLTHFGHHAARIAMSRPETFMPVSNVLATFIPRGDWHLFEQVCWWTHAVVLLAFLNYLPYSKHMHILAALPNIFFRKLGPTRDPDVGPASVDNAMSKLDLEAERERFGVGVVEDFTWKQLLDSYACTECARCSLGCPATSTGKVLSPFHIILGLKKAIEDRGKQLLAWDQENRKRLNAAGVGTDGGGSHGAANGASTDGHGEDGNGAPAVELLPKPAPDRALVGDYVQEQALWDCTTCGQCMQVCPVFIEHVPKILDMRRYLVLDEGRMPPELARTLKNLENQGNPWGMGEDKRFEWAEGLEVVTLEEAKEQRPEYLFWVGCAGAFDDRIKQVTRATVKVLKSAGVDFAVLGSEEKCTGDPARRAGQEYLFQMMAMENVETLNNYGVKKIVTACPHCFNSLKNEYPQFGGQYEVVHHTQLMAKLVEEGRLQGKSKVAEELVFHDSCYLGRWNGEYDAPRKVLDAVPHDRPRREPAQTRQANLCCGAGGARMWMEEHDGSRINRVRTKQLLDTGAETVATACPFCLVMVDDGVKDAGQEERVKVLDVAEVMAKSLG